MVATMQSSDFSRTFLWNLLEEATAGIFFWDHAADRVQWSDKLYRTLGHQSDVVRDYASIQELIHPDDQASMAAAVEYSREKHSVYKTQVRILNAKEDYQTFEVVGLWNVTPNHGDVLLGFLLDVTDEIEAHGRALRAEALFRNFFDKAPAAVFIRDRQFSNVYGNERAASLAGVSLEDYLTKSTFEIFGKETATALWEVDNRVLLKNETVHWSGEITSATGEKKFIVNTKFPVEDPVTGEVMIGCVGLDITQQRLAEQAVAQFQKMEALGQLVAGVAHDFNNILAVILGNLEVMPDFDDDRFLSSRALALDAVENGAQLTKQLLTYVRRSEVKTDAVDIQELLQKTDQLLRRVIPENIAVETSTDSDLWLAEVDPQQTRSALLNLALNAKDAMPNGGRLTIQATNLSVNDQEGQRFSNNLKTGRYVVLSVSDDGSGMTKEALERAFEPFFTTKPIGKGSGMGLAMVYGLMRQFGGGAEISSQEGIGTTVSLYLPAASGDVAVVKQDALEYSANGTEAILLVEDDSRLRQSLCDQVTSLGYAVFAAENGDEALRMIEEGLDVSLILSDVIMPGSISGPELVAEIRKRNPLLPAIFLSGYTADHVLKLSKDLGQVKVLMKPLSIKKLAEELRDSLDRSASPS